MGSALAGNTIILARSLINWTAYGACSADRRKASIVVAQGILLSIHHSKKPQTYLLGKCQGVLALGNELVSGQHYVPLLTWQSPKYYCCCTDDNR